MNSNKEIQEENINFRSYFNALLDIWYLFPIFIILFVGIAYLYNLSTPLEFKAGSTLLIEEDSKNFLSDDMLSGFGLFDKQQNIENEIAVLKSYSLSEKSVISFGSYVKYYQEKKLRRENVYKSSPFFVVIDTLEPQLTGCYKLEYKKGAIEIERQEGDGILYNFANHDVIQIIETNPEISINTKIGQWTNNKSLNIKIEKNTQIFDESEFADNIWYFYIYDLNTLALKLNGSITAEPLNKQADVISLSLTNDNPEEAVDLLNSLLMQYFEDNLNQKNTIAVRTIFFIDEQLSILADSLETNEIDLEEFRKDNMVMDVSFQSSAVYQNLQVLETSLAMAELKMKYFEYLKENLEKSTDYSNIFVPSIVGVQDLLLNKLISDLLELNSERIKISSRSTAENPLLQDIDKQIAELMSAISQSVSSLISSTQIEINETEKLIKGHEKELMRLPETERTLIGIQRNFTINNEIYTYLLQKRAESSIAQASNIPDGKIVDNARVNLTEQTQPKTTFIYFIFAIIGILIPVIYVIIKKRLFDFIDEKSVLTSATKIPLVGSIPHSELESINIMMDHPKSYISESFRSICTGLKFFKKQNDKNVTILVSSSVPGEGKTFISANLAQAYASLEKKTIIVGLDLRKPGLSYIYYKDNSKGVSTILSNQSTLDKSIQPTADSHLDVLSSGPVPPNPSALLGSEKMKALLKELKTRYEYIIIDTSPMNLTTDAIQIVDETDVLVYVVKYGYSRTKFLESINNLYNQKYFKNTSLGIVFNDIKTSRFRGYGYTYGTGYGYGKGYGYGMEKKRKGILSWIKNK